MEMNTFYKEAQAKMKAITTELEELRLQTGLLKLDAKDEYEQKMKVIHARTEEARTRVEKLRDCSERTYLRIKDELEQAFRFVQVELRDVKDRCFTEIQ